MLRRPPVAGAGLALIALLGLLALRQGPPAQAEADAPASEPVAQMATATRTVAPSATQTSSATQTPSATQTATTTRSVVVTATTTPTAGPSPSATSLQDAAVRTVFASGTITGADGKDAQLYLNAGIQPGFVGGQVSVLQADGDFFEGAITAIEITGGTATLRGRGPRSDGERIVTVDFIATITDGTPGSFRISFEGGPGTRSVGGVLTSGVTSVR